MASIRMVLAGASLMAFGFAFADAKPAHPANKNAKTGVASPQEPKRGNESQKVSTRTGTVSGRMQVEEPKAAVPMGAAEESRDWQNHHARGLTEAQKQAFRGRKEKMEGMIAVIKEKRKALRDAKPEERAMIARELHSFILEKDSEAANSGVSSTSATAASIAGSTAAAQANPSTKEATKEATKETNRAATSRTGVDAQGNEHNASPSSQADAAKTEADDAIKAEAAEKLRKRLESSHQKKE
ncbi:MAG: hypothetical protein ABIW76_03030 [Fibrobacteria bacterium]